MGSEEASEGKENCKLKRVSLKAVIEDVLIRSWKLR